MEEVLKKRSLKQKRRNRKMMTAMKITRAVVLSVMVRMIMVSVTSR